MTSRIEIYLIFNFIIIFIYLNVIWANSLLQMVAYNIYLSFESRKDPLRGYCELAPSFNVTCLCVLPNLNSSQNSDSELLSLAGMDK